jgi:hypothetical protein
MPLCISIHSIILSLFAPSLCPAVPDTFTQWTIQTTRNQTHPPLVVRVPQTCPLPTQRGQARQGGPQQQGKLCPSLIQDLLNMFVDGRLGKCHIYLCIHLAESNEPESDSVIVQEGVLVILISPLLFHHNKLPRLPTSLFLSHPPSSLSSSFLSRFYRH